MQSSVFSSSIGPLKIFNHLFIASPPIDTSKTNASMTPSAQKLYQALHFCECNDFYKIIRELCSPQSQQFYLLGIHLM